jgi:hypothetical protein
MSCRCSTQDIRRRLTAALLPQRAKSHQQQSRQRKQDPRHRHWRRIQPILTLCVVERRLQGRRLLGLLLALAGLVLLVWRSLVAISPGVTPLAIASK